MSQSCASRRRERGYILLTLMLFVAILAIGAMAWIEKVDFQIKRDHEEELIHRGVQYSRAVRRYFKKFGRYPTRIEELESSNNIRFLRKRYTDPITGKDFKPLHLTDVQISFNPGAASGLPPGPDANISAPPGPSGALNTTTTPPGDLGAGAILQNPQAPQGADQGDAAKQLKLRNRITACPPRFSARGRQGSDQVAHKYSAAEPLSVWRASAS